MFFTVPCGPTRNKTQTHGKETKISSLAEKVSEIFLIMFSSHYRREIVPSSFTTSFCRYGKELRIIRGVP